VRCSSCGATLAAGGTYGKNNTRTMQCCNYARGSCHTSHSIAIPKIEKAFIEGLKQALEEKKFPIIPKLPKKNKRDEVDYDKLIALEERRLVRAKEAYLAEIDTIEQYKQNKKEITEKIEELKGKKNKVVIQDVDINALEGKVAKVVEFIERDDVTPAAKNEALHNIIEKIVYQKAEQNLAIYFHDI
jgi:hypothetical protein